jgi:hypothetical protein
MIFSTALLNKERIFWHISNEIPIRIAACGTSQFTIYHMMIVSTAGVHALIFIFHKTLDVPSK